MENTNLTDLVIRFNNTKLIYQNTQSRLSQLESIFNARNLIHELEEYGVTFDSTDSYISTVKLYPLSIDEVNRAIQEERSMKSVDNTVTVDKRIDCEISKLNEDQNLVFGWAYVSSVGNNELVDTQGDSISEYELEKAFYDFVINYRIAGEMHAAVAGTLVECMVFTKEKQELLGIDLGKVGAWVGFKVDPDVFSKIKSGEYKMLSIGGKGRRVVE